MTLPLSLMTCEQLKKEYDLSHEDLEIISNNVERANNLFLKIHKKKYKHMDVQSKNIQAYLDSL